MGDTIAPAPHSTSRPAEAGDLPASIPAPPTTDSEWDSNWTNYHVDFDFLPERTRERQHAGWQGIEAPVREAKESGKEKAHSRKTSDSAKYFAHPTTSLPAPSLTFDFRMAVRLKAEASHINVPGTGPKELTTISGGSWSGSFGSGTVVAGGHDVTQSRLDKGCACKADTAFRLETTDSPPAALEMRTRGYISGPSDILCGLLDPKTAALLDPRQYKFRMFMTLTTTDERYAEEVNFAMWVGSGMWKGDELIIDAYRVT